MHLLRLVNVAMVTLIVTVNSEAENSTTPNPRDFLFDKPRNFVPVKVPTNKTRFTAEEKKLILDVHNAYRSLVDPPATNMRELMWDDDLEDFSWNHTQKCTGAHGPTSMIKWLGISSYYVKWDYMGENLYYRHGHWYSIEEAIWMFWEEGRAYDIATGKCTHWNTCGHYRVLVTANSSYVGCSMKVCDNFTISKYPTPAFFMACTYSGSNLMYYEPYVVGERASQCTKEMTDEERPVSRHGLCVSLYDNMYNLGFDGNTSIVGLPPSHLTTPSTRETTESDSTSPSTATTDLNMSPSTTAYDQNTKSPFSTSTESDDPKTKPPFSTSTESDDPKNKSTFSTSTESDDAKTKSTLSTSTESDTTLNMAARLSSWLTKTLMITSILSAVGISVASG
jgi:hypothetical protein